MFLSIIELFFVSTFLHYHLPAGHYYYVIHERRFKWFLNSASCCSFHAERFSLPLFIRSGVLSFFGTREAWFVISIFMITQLLLIRIVAGKRFEGPITPKGNVPIYKANGILCFDITLTLFYICTYQFRCFLSTIIYDHFGGILSTG